MGITHADRRLNKSTRFVGISKIDVLILLFHKLVTRRRYHLNDICSRWEGWFTCRGTKGVPSIKYSWPELVPGMEGIGAFGDCQAVNHRETLNAPRRFVVIPTIRPCNSERISNIENPVSVSIDVLRSFWAAR
jgi:hypothetical protein